MYIDNKRTFYIASEWYFLIPNCFTISLQYLYVCKMSE